MEQMNSMSKDQRQTPEPKQDSTPTPFPQNTATLESLHKNNQDKKVQDKQTYMEEAQKTTVSDPRKTAMSPQAREQSVLSELAWPSNTLLSYC